MPPKNFVFVMEQTLGNAVHASNLRKAFEGEKSVNIKWLDINYPPETRLDKIPPFRSNWTFGSGLKARRALSSLHSRPDLYFFHTAIPSIFSVGKTKGVPTVMSLDATPINYDTVAEAYNHKRGSNLSERLKLALHKRTFRSAKQFVVWSRWVKKSLVEDYGVPAARIEVIPPGTDLSLWKLTPEELAVRYNKPAGTPVRILFVGGDFKRKGGDLLLEAYRQIFSSETPTELHLVTKAELDSEPDKSIFIHRGITANSPEIQKLFREADIFVLPTEGDCLPMVLGEAMAASLPIISTRVGAIDEVVLEGENGLLIKPKDKDGLVNALNSLIKNPELRQKMGQRGREIAEADHDSTRNSQRLLEMCKAVAMKI